MPTRSTDRRARQLLSLLTLGLLPAALGVLVVTAVLWASQSRVHDVDASVPTDAVAPFDEFLSALYAQEPGLCELHAESFVAGELRKHGFSARNPVPRASLGSVLDPWGLLAADFERFEYTSDRMVMMSLDPLSRPLAGDQLGRIPRAVRIEAGLVSGFRGDPQWTELSITVVSPCPPGVDVPS
jgi:hypothetical protein